MPERSLPELAPEMLLSYGGMRELEGAQAMRPRASATPVETILGDLAVPPPPDEFNVSFDRDEGFDSELAGPRPSGFRSAAVGARFNVLRPPQHEPFRPPPPVSGPQGGPMREVGRVGRFSILTEQERPRDYRAEARARLEDREAADRVFPDPAIDPELPIRFANPAVSPRASRMTGDRMRSQRSSEWSARQAEERAAIHETLPTAYDRLLTDDDPFEDDLE